MELLLVGTKLPAVGAYQRGLVNSVVPGRLLDRRAEELVERLTTVNSFVDIVRDRR
jgi:enoyl-CoA hydratase/carnithine racemase